MSSNATAVLNLTFETCGKILSVLKTVENHRYSLMNKLNAHDRGELVRYAIRVGLIEP